MQSEKQVETITSSPSPLALEFLSTDNPSSLHTFLRKMPVLVEGDVFAISSDNFVCDPLLQHVLDTYHLELDENDLATAIILSDCIQLKNSLYADVLYPTEFGAIRMKIPVNSAAEYVREYLRKCESLYIGNIVRKKIANYLGVSLRESVWYQFDQFPQIQSWLRLLERKRFIHDSHMADVMEQDQEDILANALNDIVGFSIFTGEQMQVSTPKLTKQDLLFGVAALELEWIKTNPLTSETSGDIQGGLFALREKLQQFDLRK